MEVHIKSLIEKYLSLALPLKLIIGVVIGVVAGPGVIGLVSEYATYVYAIKIGIRPPLEGIPYLSATVTAGGLFLALSASAIFMLTRVLVARIVTRIISGFSDASKGFNLLSLDMVALFKLRIPKSQTTEILNMIRNLKPKEAMQLSLLLSVIVGLLFYFLEFYISKRVEPNPLMVGITSGVFIFVIFLTLWREAAIWWVAACAALGFYVLSFYFIFSINHYSDFLRLVGYGGGSEVTIEFNKQSNEYIDKPFYLLLRTTNSLICLDKDEKTVTEIPISTISNIKYNLGSNNHLNINDIANKKINKDT
ncbi:hypothetical protein [Thalassomonas sp. RHCl1]|uniref:hypothetical protein n=1 Tax=Thalassomonas sp. RHCl1 TaxID=2995320 RepID=UPI00248AACF4|nr:hypothetical protein [Thalassomonas sp. RHCl1]